MRGMSFWILPLAVFASFVGCQSNSTDQDAAIAALEERVAELTRAQDVLAAAHGGTDAEVLRLETEKATREELAEALSRPKPWSIPIALESAWISGAGSWSPMPPAGVRLKESAYSSLHVSFTLPEDYIEGSAFELRLAWTKETSFIGVPCNVFLISDTPYATRPGKPQFRSSSAFRGDASGSDASIPLPAGTEIQSLVVDVRGGALGDLLRAGDVVTYSLSRTPTSADDTCMGSNASVVLVSMSAHSTSP